MTHPYERGPERAPPSTPSTDPPPEEPPDEPMRDPPIYPETDDSGVGEVRQAGGAGGIEAPHPSPDAMVSDARAEQPAA